MSLGNDPCVVGNVFRKRRKRQNEFFREALDGRASINDRFRFFATIITCHRQKLVPDTGKCSLHFNHKCRPGHERSFLDFYAIYHQDGSVPDESLNLLASGRCKYSPVFRNAAHEPCLLLIVSNDTCQWRVHFLNKGILTPFNKRYELLPSCYAWLRIGRNITRASGVLISKIRRVHETKSSLSYLSTHMRGIQETEVMKQNTLTIHAMTISLYELSMQLRGNIY